MTLIVALEDSADGSVLLAADSAVTRGHVVDGLAQRKLRRVGRIGIAFAGSVGAYQVASEAIRGAPRRRGESPEVYLRRVVAAPAYRALTVGGFTRQGESSPESPLELVLGYEGRAYSVGVDASVVSTDRGFEVAGVAEDIARGALYATADLDPRSRVEMAFGAACAFSPGVRPPVHYLRVRA